MSQNPSSQRIPVLDLKRQYEQVGEDLERAVIAVLRSGSYILGQQLAALESEIARLCRTTHAVGVANGTDALILALWSLDIGPGDEVITTPFTFAATAEAIAIRGATPVFVDICPRTYNIDPALIEKAITSKTRAIMPVHLYGHPAEMDAIMDMAGRHGLYVIEDNAQAVGALYRGRPTGSFGTVACISFYPTKNLGAAGDAGMLVTSDERVAERLTVLRAHGSRRRYYHDEVGVNSRLDELQAAVLLAKLPHLERWNAKRRAVAEMYARHLSGCPGLLLPESASGVSHVWHQYTVRVSGGSAALRDRVKAELSDLGVDSMCYYPLPLHMQPAFAQAQHKEGDFPVTETVAREVLSLPMYPELSEEEVARVAKVIRQVLGAQAAMAVPTVPQSYPVAGA